jgi:hypothetical protein
MVSSGCSATTCAIPERTPAAVDASTLTMPLAVEELRSCRALSPTLPGPAFPRTRARTTPLSDSFVRRILGAAQEFGGPKNPSPSQGWEGLIGGRAVSKLPTQEPGETSSYSI